MDKNKIKEIIESSLDGSSAIVDGGEGKYNATIVYKGFDGLNTVKRHKVVYNSLNSYIQSGELHAISLKTFSSEEEKT
tara:strand:- start:36 stop:269 length:234 start_codon:yes stop_codon:yes gene_type:complete